MPLQRREPGRAGAGQPPQPRDRRAPRRHRRADRTAQRAGEGGEEEGDEALAAVGAVLRGGVRASDFAGRWGGEEFVILLPDTDAAGAAALAEKLRAAIAAAQVPSVPAGITASFGAASLPAHAHDADSLLRAADRALYAAKQGGRDRVELAAGSDAPVA